MPMMSPFAFNTAKSIVFGPGTSRDLRLVAHCLGPRVLVITDANLRSLGVIETALMSLRRSGVEVTVFDAIEPDPSQKTVGLAVAAGASAEVTGVLGIGGGSSLDVAKLAALLLGSGEDLDQAWGVGNAKGPRLPLCLAPTTAGTGSEVTPVSVITVSAGDKLVVSSPLLLPDIAVLDPDLTLGLPAAITAMTGIDAMVHAIESYTSANPNNNPISRVMARQALTLLGGSIEAAVRDGSNREARSSMLLGSMFAGQAFANSPVAAVHAFAYPLGGTFHIPHGLSNALVLRQVLQFNLPVASGHYSEMAPDLFPDLVAIGDPEERARVFIDRLAKLSIDLGLASRLRDVGIPRDAVKGLARDAMKQVRLLANNPRQLTEEDAIGIYEAVW
jgi:alcohol dehydrogenase class IV